MSKRNNSIARSSAAGYLTFVAAGGHGGVDAVYANENVWLTQKMMGLLYNVETHTVNYHLKKVFADSELEEASVIRNFRITASDDKTYDTKHYNLAAIIAVGYKVNSERAVQFRKWATAIIKTFIMKTIIKLVFMIIGIFIMIQCTNDDDLLLNQAILQGTWVEVEPKDIVQYAGENHTYTFTEDSFFLKLNRWTDMLLPDDTIPSDGNIYARGTYLFDSKTIEISGEMCNSTFTEKRGNLPDFNSKYNYLLKAVNEIVLNSEYDIDGIILIKE